MKLNFNVHARSGQSSALQTALAEARAEKAGRNQDAPTAAPSNVRARISQRLGLSNAEASNEEIFAALDGTLAAAKAKRAPLDAAGALYNAAWGDPRTNAEPPTFSSPEDAALYAAAWGTSENAV